MWVMVCQCWLSLGSEILQLHSNIRQRSQARRLRGTVAGLQRCRAFLHDSTSLGAIRIYLPCRGHLRVPVYQRVDGSCCLYSALDDAAVGYLVQVVLEGVEHQQCYGLFGVCRPHGRRKHLRQKVRSKALDLQGGMGLGADERQHAGHQAGVVFAVGERERARMLQVSVRHGRGGVGSSAHDATGFVQR
jgi:hypothetical protein